MATLTIPITVEQIRELARQLSTQERQALLDSLLGERFDAVLSDAVRQKRTGHAGEASHTFNRRSGCPDGLARQLRRRLP